MIIRPSIYISPVFCSTAWLQRQRIHTLPIPEDERAAILGCMRSCFYLSQTHNRCMHNRFKIFRPLIVYCVQKNVWRFFYFPSFWLSIPYHGSRLHSFSCCAFPFHRLLRLKVPVFLPKKKNRYRFNTNTKSSLSRVLHGYISGWRERFSTYTGFKGWQQCTPLSPNRRFLWRNAIKERRPISHNMLTNHPTFSYPWSPFPPMIPHPLVEKNNSGRTAPQN